MRRIAIGGPISIRTGRAVLSTQPETVGAKCICRTNIDDGRTMIGYACQCPVALAKRKVQQMSSEQNIFRNMNVTEAEVDTHQRRQRVDAVLAASAGDSEGMMVAHMTLTHRDLAGDRFARRHAEHAVAAHAAVPARVLIATARGIARSAGESDDVSEGIRKLRTAIGHIASAAARARGANMLIASARGAGGRHAIGEGRRLAGEMYRPNEQDADALLGEAMGLLEECEGNADAPENFKALCLAGALLEMLLDEITPAYTHLHPDEIGGGEIDENYAMPPLEKMAAVRDGLTEMERTICRNTNVTVAAYLAAKVKRRIGQ